MMKYCKACKVSVDNPVERCPLCYSVLSPLDSQPELPSYPGLLEQSQKSHLIFRILLMVSITLSTISATINFLTFSSYPNFWSLLVVINIAYMWVAIGTAVRRRSKLGFNIMVQVISLAALCVGIDFLSGRANWALNYVVPFLFISAILSITIIVIVRHVAIHSFILYFVLIALLGFLPVVFLAFDLVSVSWPSIVSALYAALSLVSIFVFAHNATKIELKKRFHL